MMGFAFFTQQNQCFLQNWKKNFVLLSLNVLSYYRMTMSTIKCLQISKSQQNYGSAQKLSFVDHSTKEIGKS